MTPARPGVPGHDDGARVRAPAPGEAGRWPVGSALASAAGARLVSPSWQPSGRAALAGIASIRSVSDIPFVRQREGEVMRRRLPRRALVSGLLLAAAIP